MNKLISKKQQTLKNYENFPSMQFRVQAPSIYNQLTDIMGFNITCDSHVMLNPIFSEKKEYRSIHICLDIASAAL